MGVDRNLILGWVGLSTTPHLPHLVTTGQWVEEASPTVPVGKPVSKSHHVKLGEPDFWRCENTRRFVGIYAFDPSDMLKPIRLLSV